jgi:hypothetical protein
VRTRGGRAVLPSSWIIVAFWIVAIVFTVAYVDVERASHPYEMTGVAHSSIFKHPKRLRTAHARLTEKAEGGCILVALLELLVLA